MVAYIPLTLNKLNLSHCWSFYPTLKLKSLILLNFTLGTYRRVGLWQCLCAPIGTPHLHCRDTPSICLCLLSGPGDLQTPHGVTWDMRIICKAALLMPLLFHPPMTSGVLLLWGLNASTRNLSENRTQFLPFQSRYTSLSYPQLEEVFLSLMKTLLSFLLFPRPFFFFFGPLRSYFFHIL